MSRMASMQVLNQAFANANAAFNAYMRNKNEQRRNDLLDEFGRLDRQYRVQQAAQRQENLDRAYELSRNNGQQAQENWQAEFNMKQHSADAAKRAQNMGAIANILSVAPDAASANALANGLGVGFNDQIVQGAFFNDYYNQRKLRELRKQFDDFQNFASKLASEKSKQLQKERSEQLKYDIEKAKIRQAEEADILKNAIPYITAKIQNSTNKTPPNMAKAIAEFNEMKSRLNGTYAPNNGGIQAQTTSNLTATDLETKVKSGELTREQAYNIAKQNGLLK